MNDDLTPITPNTAKISVGDTVGRDEIVNTMLRELAAGNHLLLVDPRRMGKTTTLRLLCHQAHKPMIAVLTSLEGASSTDEVLTRIASALLGEAKLTTRAAQALSVLFDSKGADLSVGPLSVKAAFDKKAPHELVAITIDSVESKLDDGECLVLVLDEVPLAIQKISELEGKAAAGLLLEQLRSLREKSERVRWVLSGSIGFHHVLREAGTTEGAINELDPIVLGPLAFDHAVVLARRLVFGIGRDATDDVLGHMVELTGCIPFLLHKVAHELHSLESTTKAGPVGADEVDRAWERFMDRDSSRAMTHLVTRLDDYPADTRAPARALLDFTAKNQSPLSLAEAIALLSAAGIDHEASIRTIDYLTDDHYLQRADNMLTWRYDVLRRIWCHRRML